MSTAADRHTEAVRGGTLPPSKVRRPAAPTHVKENEGEAPSMMTPDRPASLPADAAMFAPMTADEIGVLCAHLTSGWYKQHHLGNDRAGWWETADVLKDLGTAWDAAFDADQCARATCRSCGASGAVVDLEKYSVRPLADGATYDEWQCADRQACAARLAPDLDRVLAAGGAR